MLDSTTLHAMPTEQIKNMLSQDIAVQGEGSLTPEEIVAAMEELEAREGPALTSYEVKQAWKDFNENYRH